MRRAFGGWLFVALWLLSATLVRAQVTGTVDTIGFDGRYRAGCWTPMLVRLQATGAPTGLYELRVWQHDADGDLPYYSTKVTLTQGREQRFWTYFIPEPIHGGLTNAQMAPDEFAARLRITVHDAGGNEIGQVSAGSSIPQPVDPIIGRYNEHERPRKFVVFVRDGTSSPPLRDYALGSDPRKPSIVGLSEDLESVVVQPDRLPESMLGYDGVDDVVWLEGDAGQLGTGGSRRLEALRQYVSTGGHLIINSPANWQSILSFEDLLPVDALGTATSRDLNPARAIAERPFPTDNKLAPKENPWTKATGTFTLVRATPRAGSNVDLWADLASDDDATARTTTGPTTSPAVESRRTPWLVRRPVGVGCVSWVAQDLGASELTRRLNWGWPRVWETVFGNVDQPTVLPSLTEADRFKPVGLTEFGTLVLDPMNLPGQTAKLVGVTILFFVGYWLLAGPGTFFYLRARGRATASWFAFGVVALVATAVTLGLVRLVLLGGAEVQHVSLVRVGPDRLRPSVAISRLGVYIKRDGPQTFALTKADLDERYPSTITPFPIHPSLQALRGGDDFLFKAPKSYGVALPTDSAPPTVDVPFRTTMKRLEARQFGIRPEQIDGTASLRPITREGGTVAGTLKNLSGHDLENVWVALRHRTEGGEPTDHMAFVAAWNNGATLDLDGVFNPPGKANKDTTIGLENVRPNEKFAVHGLMREWALWFGGDVRGGLGDSLNPRDGKDLDRFASASIPVLSLFKRIGAIPNTGLNADGSRNVTRTELHRSGLRDWDASNALLAGNLVILAQASNTETPVPLTIEGDPAGGTGTTVYQFVVPLNPIPPTTRSATTRAAD